MNEIDIIGQNIAQALQASTVIEGDFVPSKAQIRAMQDEMIAAVTEAGLPMTPTQVEHLFADGLYARKYPMPAGQWAVTKTHRKKHFIVSCGDCTIWTDTAMKRLVGFHCFITHPGTKRVIHAHADTLFITFHATSLTDPDAIEAELIEPEPVIFEEVRV
jgi:hypothetical protein